VQAFLARGDEIANHGLRWIHHQHMPEATERRHIAVATDLMHALTGGVGSTGWYTGRDSPNTRRLVADQGGYEYDSDYYGDDLPFWLQVKKTNGTLAPHLVVPYALDTNDMRCVQAQGFNTGEHFFTYLRDAFDALYAEGETAPKMMSVGMHCRLLGKPARIAVLQRFLDHIQARDRVWICRRIDIARHWKATHPFDPATAFVWQ
jgi:peptidoglycan/xylan/chitin deacetylase (PgdA/CDA1 family)